jgi:hypothetical protein
MSDTPRTLDEHFAQVLESAQDVDVPDEIRAEHQIDRTRLEERAQCVCSCGASCVSYACHLVEAAEHRELWNEMNAKHGHPLEAFIRVGIDPYRDL